MIQDVSDTALWVATYRAIESERADALFHDPLARRLAGDRGFKIAKEMPGTTRIQWVLVVRTRIIDRMIEEAVASGVDTIVNLGAGLDARPYRMNLPSSLKWIEVDFPHMIEHKEKVLSGEIPKFQLERIKLDLSNREERREFFGEINARSKNILVLTEGVVLYLQPSAVAELAEDLREMSHVSFWITEYFAANAKKYVFRGKMKQRMKHSPMVFFPQDWIGFFRERGWKVKELKYTAVEGAKLGRPFPIPKPFSWIFPLMSQKKKDFVNHLAGYTLWEKA